MTDMGVLRSILSAPFLFATIRVSTPILLASLGGLTADLAGVINIALEGIMLTSALIGVVASAFAHSALVGVFCGMLAGVALTLLLAYFQLHLGANGILTGMAINMLASGGTVFLLFSLTRDKAFSTGLQSLSLPNLKIPLIGDLPFVGDTLSGHNLMTYIAFLLVPLVHGFLYHTRFGMHLRGVGENPVASSSVGIDVVKTQYGALALSGVLASLGGINLSMGYLNLFVKDMTAGRGFIALAAVYLGRRTPVGVMYASLLFGMADALANQLGSLQIPPQVVLAIPYVVTIAALVINNIQVENAKLRFASGGRRASDERASDACF